VIIPSGGVRVLVATKPVDFRKGLAGLAALVREAMGGDPFSGAVFVFRAKRADRVKLIFWDGTGMVLVCKRLEDGKFRWPGCFTALRKITGKSQWAFPHSTQPDEPMATEHIRDAVRRVMADGLAQKMPFVGGNGASPMVWGDEAEAATEHDDKRERQTFTAHGFRASFKSHCRAPRLGADDVVERVLAHAQKGMDRALPARGSRRREARPAAGVGRCDHARRREQDD
jgi:transposase